MFAHLLAQFGHEEELLEGVLHSLDVALVLLVLSLQVEQIHEEAGQAEDVQDGHEKQNQNQDEAVDWFAQCLADSEDEGVAHHHLHYRLTLLDISIVAADDLVVPLDEGGFFLSAAGLHLHDGGVDQRFAQLFRLHCYSYNNT